MNVFNIKKNDVISIVGAGGKTSLLYSLGKKLSGSTLLTTSTKIYTHDKVYINEMPSIIKNGYYVLAKEEKGSKLIGYSEEKLVNISKNFDYTIIEADGANELNLKGWNDLEPVIHSFSNKTIGVLDIKTIGLEVNDTTIFRLDKFKELTNSLDVVTTRNLVDIVLSEKGMFKKSKNKILYINKVESDIDKQNANILVDMLLEDDRFDLEQIVIGSVKNNEYKSVFEKVSVYVLASGNSKRMNEDKLLIDYKGKKMIEHILSKLSGYDNKYLICKDDRLLSLSDKYNFKYLVNRNNDLGISESIKLAVNNVKSMYYVFFLGDMPNVKDSSIKRLFLEDKEGISAFKHKKIISIPAKFSKKYKEDLLNLNGDSGAKKIILNNLYDVNLFEVTEEELYDFDTKEDLRKLG